MEDALCVELPSRVFRCDHPHRASWLRPGSKTARIVLDRLCVDARVQGDARQTGRERPTALRSSKTTDGLGQLRRSDVMPVKALGIGWDRDPFGGELGGGRRCREGKQNIECGGPQRRHPDRETHRDCHGVQGRENSPPTPPA
jgi:hypothetical protein